MSPLLEARSLREALQLLYRPIAKPKRVSSAAFYSRKLGYKSPRLLEMVLKGDRSATADFLSRTAQLFSLSEVEQNLLELLSQKEKLAAKGRSTTLVDKRLQGLKNKVVSVQFVEPQFFTLFSDWHCFVIKQLLPAYPKGLTVAEIVKKLKGKAGAESVEKALHTLLNLGYVDRGDSGAFVIRNQDAIYTRPDIPSAAVRKHHKQMMERAMEALEEKSVSEREMISLTFSCPPSALPRLKEALRKFRDEINAEFSSSSPSVFQLNLQLFPHAES